MANITNSSGEVILASPSEQTVPVEYAGLTIKQIYDAMCVEHGLDPAAGDNKLTGDFATEEFTLSGNMFYDIGNPTVMLSKYSTCFHFYKNTPTGTENDYHKTVDVSNLGISDSMGIPYGRNSIPYFTIGFADNWGNFTIRKDVVSTSNSSPSANILYALFNYNANTYLEITIRILLSGAIDVYVQKGTIANNASGGFLAYTQAEGDPLPSTLTFDASRSTAWNITDNNVHYYNSPEVERAFIKGVVQNGAGNYLARKVTVLDSATKGVRNVTTSSAVDGSFSISVSPDTEYMVICEDQGVEPKNALVFDRVFGLPDA